MHQLLSGFCHWLDQTAVSQAIQSHGWVVPTVQTVHILMITLVAGSALMLNLRLVHRFAADQPFRIVSARFMPFLLWPILILLASGAIMIAGEPARSLLNPAFQLKMALLAGALLVTALIASRARRDPGFGDRVSSWRNLAGLFAIVSTLLWTGIIFSGRWIAYYS